MKKDLRLVFLLLLVSLLLYVLDKNKKLDFFKSIFSGFNNPSLKTVQSLKQKGGELINPSSEANENIRVLEQENTLLQAELAAVKKDSQACQELLGSPLPADWKFVQAHNLGIKDGVMSLDRGAEHGVKEGDTVLVKNMLVGRVVQVLPGNCQVDLLFAKNIDFSMSILGSGVAGNAFYDSRLQKLFIKDVSNESNILIGETVVSSAKKGVFPPDLVIGKIEKVQKIESEISQQAIIRPLLDYSQLSVVFVRL